MDNEDRVHHVVGTNRVTRGMARAAHIGQVGPSYPIGGAEEEEGR